MILLFMIVILSLCSKIIVPYTYDGCKVYEVIPEKPEHQEILALLHSTKDFDFWSNYRTLNKPAIIMVKPTVLDSFSKIMKDNGFKNKELIADVERFFLEKFPRSRMVSVTNGTLPIDRFNTYKTIKAYLNNLPYIYPDKLHTYSIGRTIEGRDIWIVKLSLTKSYRRDRPAILIDAGIHAREWIAPATALYLIHQLAEHSANENMLMNVDWYIAPLLNPDGYEFSQKADRLWRKNRHKGKVCFGVDGNRNFDFHWMEGGSSADECSETFAGKMPFSEHETIALRDFVSENRNNIKLYITLHSYGSLLLYPWNYSPTLPDNVDELSELARKVCDSIEQVNGTTYVYGTSNNVLYQASGNSEDWMKGSAGIDMSFALELPGGGETGFDVPESMIEPIGKETFSGIQVFWNYVTNKWGPD